MSGAGDSGGPSYCQTAHVYRNITTFKSLFTYISDGIFHYVGWLPLWWFVVQNDSSTTCNCPVLVVVVLWELHAHLNTKYVRLSDINSSMDTNNYVVVGVYKCMYRLRI